MRVFCILCISLMLMMGCAQEEKTVPVVIKVKNTQGQPVSYSVIGITAIIPKELQKKVAAIPMAISTNEKGELVKQLTSGWKYEIFYGEQKRIVEVKDQPMTVEFIAKE
jgi:hypothetical protein